MHCMVASSIPCKLSLCADRAHACAGDSYVSSGIDVACPTTQSVLAIASPHELQGDSWPSSSTGTSSFCCNQQYSVTAITTSTGAIAERYAYTAYGQPTILNASGTPLSPQTSTLNSRYSYTGREWDATLALHHFRARWMSGLTGRFFTRDPIGYWDGLNAYLPYFALNSMDPLGLSKLNAPITVKGPTAGDCGQFSWTIQWKLDAVTKKGGWIVQHVTVDFDVKDCDDKAIDVKKHTKGVVDPSYWPLWEAWEVNKNSDVTKYADKGDKDDDEYAMPSFGDCTKGKITITGVADYYDGLALPKPPFAVTNKPPAGILPSTTTDPKLGKGSGSVNHNIVAEWNCCPKGTKGKTSLKTEPR